jgi:hypothetical protein
MSYKYLPFLSHVYLFMGNASTKSFSNILFYYITGWNLKKKQQKIEYAKFVVFVVTIKINKTTLTFSYIKLIFSQIEQNWNNLIKINLDTIHSQTFWKIDPGLSIVWLNILAVVSYIFMVPVWWNMNKYKIF